MKTRLFLALVFICCSQVLFAQTEKDETKPESPRKEQSDEKPADAPKTEAKPDQNVKAVPVTKERKSKPAKVSGPRPAGARPARPGGKPAARPVKPGNGRK